MQRNKVTIIVGILFMCSLLLLAGAGWLTLKSLPSRYLSRLPKFAQQLVIPEPESALLPTVAFSGDAAAALLAPAGTPEGDRLNSAETTPQPTATETATPAPENTPTAVPTATPTATPTQTPSPTPTRLPDSHRLTNVVYHQQDWNNCGPATLAMALSILDLQITQYDATPFLKPNPEDRNVSPYEMADYVNQSTTFQAAIRINGSLELLKQLLVHEFPVIIEVGDRAPSEVAWVDSELNASYRDWWGHYLLAAGYDDAAQELWVYNSLIWDIESETNTNAGQAYSYEDLTTFWPQFNGSYIVLYPSERLEELNVLLGDSADPQIMRQQALENTQLALQTHEDDPFLWFNLGSTFTEMGRYEEAATAFDKARSIGLPWRMLWYQFGPYESYYEMGRYEDIILLTETTLNARPYFEESFYWRGRAREAMGDVDKARTNYQWAVDFQPNFTPAIEALAALDS